AGSFLTAFDIFVGEDNLLNSNSPSNREAVTITASVANWDSDDDLLMVEDNEPYQLALSLVPQVTENGGNVASGGTVSLSGIATVPIVISLTSTPPNAVFGPASVT